LSNCATTEDTDTNGGYGVLVHGRTTNNILSYLGCLVETEKKLPVGIEGLTIDFGD